MLNNIKFALKLTKLIINQRTCQKLTAINGTNFKIINKNYSNTKTTIEKDDNDLNEDIYWEKIKSSLETETTLLPQHNNQEKKVFIIQLRMQHTNKIRQSTTAELQLQESIGLVHSLNNMKVVGSLIISTKRIFSSAIFGSGNEELLRKMLASKDIDCLFVGNLKKAFFQFIFILFIVFLKLVVDKLTIKQTNQISKDILVNKPDVQIYDRYKIVLEIFKRNARTQIAKLQIAAAEIPYLRNIYLNKDLYQIAEKKIKRELAERLKTRKLLNEKRHERKIPIVSVFGYTNAGKTSFIQRITEDTKMEPKDQMFATLDVTYHGRVSSKISQNIIYVDTIGFISDLPHSLVLSFKTTMEDALDADLYVRKEVVFF
jgi:50S ribosomal subunit-associated GTPase HflX